MNSRQNRMPISTTERKGIVLAGGAGTRLYPVTDAVSKQLLPVYDKPMIYYPLSTLLLAGIRDILVISTPGDTPRYRALLGDGSKWGIHLSYAIQPQPQGIAQAFLIAEQAGFLKEADNSACALILGDNLFYGHDLQAHLESASASPEGATVFAYPVTDPHRYGVVDFDESGTVRSIVEKPANPASRYAVTGLYFYDGTVLGRARALRPSRRGELEITDLNNLYRNDGMLSVRVLGRGHAWLDTGTHDALLDASTFIQTIERRQGLKVCCPEEVAWRMGYINDAQLERIALPMRQSGYGAYLLRLLEETGPRR